MRYQTRLLAAGIAFASLLVSAGATAAPEKQEKGSKEGGGAAAGGGAPAGSESGPATRDQIDSSSHTEGEAPEHKFWNVGIGAEYHRLFIQNDLEGAAANKNLMVYSAQLGVDPTPNDKILLRGFIYERFLADPGESGVRSDDLILSYTHYFHLPYQMTLKPGAWVTAPTSFTSQKASSITSPRVYVSLDKAFGKYVHVEPRVAGDYYIVQYGTYDQGATPNARTRFGMGVDAEVQMPFHPALSVGAYAGTAYYSYYRARSSNNQPNVQDTQFPGEQPIQQTYGAELYARYDFSRFHPQKLDRLHWDFTLSVANGDPSIGYASAIHDGSLAVYWGFRQTAEVYGVLAARY